MGIKFDRKKTNEDEIKKIMSNKINSNYMNGNQIWKIKKIIGVKLKNICNVIAYSKIKK
jgi:hypothetical protein